MELIEYTISRNMSVRDEDLAQQGAERNIGQLERLLEDLKKARETGDIFDWRIVSDEIGIKNMGSAVENDAPYDVYALVDKRPRPQKEESTIRFTTFSWKQFAKYITLPVAYAQRLHRDDRELLIENMKYCIKTSKPGYLLRIRKDEHKKCFLRAMLPVDYNRLDNIYLIEPIIRLVKEKNMQVHNIVCTEDDMIVDLVWQGVETLLSKVNDKVLTGIRIVNSEVDSAATLYVEAYYERLVCTNGMTVKEIKQIRAPKSLSASLQDKFYQNVLPPYPPSSGFQAQLYEFLSNALRILHEDTEEGLDILRSQLEELLETELYLDNKASVQAYIREMLYHSGFRAHAGISVDDIYDAFEEEKRDFPDTQNTALILYNAFTRYISNYLTDRDREQPLARGPGRPSRSTFRDNLRLSRRLISRSHQLLPDSLDWQKIIRAFQPSKAPPKIPPLPDVE